MRKIYNKSKKGLTLGELLLVFIVMGIVATMTMVSVKPNETSMKYVYYRVYNTLGTAFYNASINFPESLKDPDGTSADAKTVDKNFPLTTEKFCLMLLEYINTKGGAQCSNANSIDINTATTAGMTDDNYQFIASNGVKFWIGYVNATSAGHNSTLTETDASGTDFNIRYFIVVADLNGDRGPNTAVNSGAKMADRVGFIVTEDYEVVPIGQPEIDIRYLTANVAYSSSASGTSDDDVDMSEPMSYLEAKRDAWGIGDKKFYISSNEPMSVNFYGTSRITSTSPFYIDYNSSDSNISTIMSKVAEANCRKDGIASNDVDSDACYLKIKDFY